MLRANSICLYIVLAANCSAQQSRGTVLLSPSDLATTGIAPPWAEKINEIYLGKLQSPTDATNDTERGALLSSYLRSYGTACPRYVPKDGVALTENRCATTRIVTRGYQRTETCIRYEEIPTGFYADRNISSLRSKLAGAPLRDLFSSTAQNGLALANFLTAIRTASIKLIEENSCESPALRRYQDNLVRLLQGANPLQLSDPAFKSPIDPPTSPPLPSPDASEGQRPITTSLNLPAWIKTGRGRVRKALLPGDQPEFDQIMDRLESDIAREGWVSAREELVRIHQVAGHYSDKCYNVAKISKGPSDDSGCDGKDALESYYDAVYSYVYEKQYPAK